MKNLILATLFVTTLNVLLLTVVVTEADRPDVYKSWSSGQCVKVQNTKAHNCANLPKKYNTVWVQ